MDVTGSMGGAIDKMKLYFTEIRKAFDSPDCRWAVCSYRDFEDGSFYLSPGYYVHQTFTSDYDLVASALDSLAAGGGGDAPEEQFVALKQIAIDWETMLGGNSDPIIHRAIIWCGDFPGWNSGAKSMAYPTFNEVVSALVIAKIQLMALNVYGPGSGIDDTAGSDDIDFQASRLVSAVGGRIFHNMQTSELGDVLEDVCGFLIDLIEGSASEQMHNGVTIGGKAEEIRIQFVTVGGGIMDEGVANETLITL